MNTTDPRSGQMTAILPCNDLDASEAFYARLGFARAASDLPPAGQPDTYRILSNGKGSALHLIEAVRGWAMQDRTPFGLYLRTEDVEVLADAFAGETVDGSGAEEKPWGMYEFALSDPDDTLVRIGWPSDLRAAA